MVVAYTDGGQVLLDVTNPAKVSLIAQSDYAELDEQRLAKGDTVTPEGNAHQGVLSPNHKFVLGVDSSTVPRRDVVSIDGGPYAGDTFTYLEGANTAPIEPGTAITGPTTFVGQACDPLPPGTGTALIERGTCSFQIKADTIKAAGYTAGIVFNSTAGCNDLQGMSMDGTTIPFVFVARSTGLKLLGQSDLPCSNTVAVGTTSHPVTIGRFFVGWGYARLFGTALSSTPGAVGTMRQIGTYAVAESQDPGHDTGFGILSVAHVALDPDNSSVAYLAYNNAGLRVVRYGKDGISETGAFIDSRGNNLVDVVVWKDDSGRTYVLAADRDFGLYVFGG